MRFTITTWELRRKMLRRSMESREMQDAFALVITGEKHCAQGKEGRFRDEIAIVEVPQKKAAYCTLPRTSTFATRRCRRLWGCGLPSFLTGGTVTAGNSSGINDAGAAAMLVASGRF